MLRFHNCARFFSTVAFVGLIVGSSPVFADTAYDQYLGTWTGQWKSNSGSKGDVKVTCRRGSSLGPNCTAAVTLTNGRVLNLPISPDVQPNGTLRWRNGPLDYRWEKVRGNSLKIRYKVRKDAGVWEVRK